MNIRRTLALAAVSAAVASTTACLGDSTGVASATVETTTFASSLGVDLTKSTKTTNGAYVRDLVVGTGPVVAAGDTISVRYTGWLSNGAQFDSNTSAPTTFGVRIGAHLVIPGWEEGLPGMRVGGTRQILIPPALAYGANQYGPIPGNSVLVFNVQLVGNP
jgi:FKBP-type peptidyl-prolyl cis-trans isomerases 1